MTTPLRCHKCGYVWEYSGRSSYRTTCPACHITVYLDKCTIPAGVFQEIKIARLKNELEKLEN